MIQILVLLFALLWVVPSWAALGSSPSKSASCTDTDGTMTCTYVGGVNAGDHLWFGSAVRAGSVTLSSVSDPTNGAWTCDAEAQIVNGGAGNEAAGCYFENSAGTGGSDLVVTATYSGAATTYGHITSWTGVATSASKDDFAEDNSDTGQPWLNGSITTTGAALIFSVTAVNASIVSAVAGDSFTTLSTAARAHFQYRVVSSSTTTSGEWSESGTGTAMAGVVMSFKEAAGGAVVNFYPRRLQVTR